MNFRIPILLLSFLMLTSGISEAASTENEAGPDTILPVELQGVWAGPNCELVQTGQFALFFERLDDKLVASLIGYKINGDMVIREARGIAMLDTNERLMAIKACDLLKGGELLVDHDSTNLIRLTSDTCRLSRGDNSLLLTAEDQNLSTLELDDYRLKVYTPSGAWRDLELIEKLTVVEPYAVPAATADNIDRCLQQWELGTRKTTEEDSVTVGLEFTTNRHSYVFYFSGMIYCRAARIRSNDHGTVFAQNIRMMWKPKEFTAVMRDNNLQQARSELVIQDSLFNPDVCIYAEDGIYWSVKSISDSLIVINGCGQNYHRALPPLDDTYRIEWYSYQDY
jgi:hypothetical protein